MRNVRAYRRHLLLRLTYLEAEVLVKLVSWGDGYEPSGTETAAANRVARKVRQASETPPPPPHCYTCGSNEHDTSRHPGGFTTDE